MKTITLYTRSNCHLCDAARGVIERVIKSAAGSLPSASVAPVEPVASLQIVDIDHDAALRARYDWHVPVILVDGIEIARHRLDAATLRAALGINAD